jgi:hypothetical protein
MRRRQIQLLRDEHRRTVNIERAVETPPVIPEEPVPVKRGPGRPRKVTNDHISGRSGTDR